MMKRRLFRVVPVIVAALALTAALAAASSALDDMLSASSAIADGTGIHDWRFASDDTGQVFDDDAEIAWKYADRTYGIRKPFFDRYIRVTTELPPQTEEGLLLIRLHAYDAEIYLDGSLQEASVQTSPLTLKKTIHVRLLPSDAPRQLVMKVRTGAALDMSAFRTTAQATRNADRILEGIKFPLIVTTALIGLLVFLIALGLSVQVRRTLGIAATGLLILSTSACILLTERLDYLSIREQVLSPYFTRNGYPKEILFVLSMLVFAVYALFLRSIRKKHALSAIVLLAFFISGVLPIAPMLSTYYIPALLISVGLMLLTAMVLLVNYCSERRACAFHERVHAFALVLVAFSMAYDFLNPVLKLNSGSSGIFYWAVLFFAYSDIYRAVLIAVHVNVRIDERAEQTRRNSLWVERIFAEGAKIFARQEIDEFCMQTARSVRKLIVDDIEETTGNIHDETHPGIPEPALSVALKNTKDGEYHEIFNSGPVNGCDYRYIERLFAGSSRGGIFFGGTYVAMLLLNADEPCAIIYIEGIAGGISENLRNILNIAYSNIAIAFDNLKLKEDILHTEESVFTYLAEMTEAKSEETGMHLKRVSEYVRAICEEMGMSRDEARVVAIGSMMHDVGKLAIPEELINKKGKLTDEEYDIVKQHVRFGKNMLSKSEGAYMDAGAVIAQQHHERWDGSGYLGLKGEQIHPYARITSLADVFDALTSHRSYKTAWTVEEACGYIMEKSGEQFDPEIVRVFLRSIGRIREIRDQYPD